jgi:hypothetical protein
MVQHDYFRPAAEPWIACPAASPSMLKPSDGQRDDDAGASGATAPRGGNRDRCIIDPQLVARLGAQPRNLCDDSAMIDAPDPSRR